MWILIYNTMIGQAQVEKLMQKHKVNTVFPVEYLTYATNVESEHRDTVGNNPDLFFQIALDHIKEFPDYYYRLKKMEEEASNYWLSKAKPDVFVDSWSRSPL